MLCFDTGNYTSLTVVIHLRRHYGYFILQTYIPCILVVGVSWASFWLDVQATPARASLGILTVLTMATLASGFTAVLPRVPYVKAMDIWLCTCLMFVVSAFVEFSIAHILTRWAQEAKTKMNHYANYRHSKPPQKPPDSASTDLDMPENPRQGHAQVMHSIRGTARFFEGQGCKLRKMELCRVRF